MVLRSLFRALPPVARRDELIAQRDVECAQLAKKVGDLRSRIERARGQRAHLRAELTAVREELREARAQLDEPSWRSKRAQRARLAPLLRGMGASDIAWQVDGKEAGYRFARSLGLDVPAELVRYRNIRDVVWDDLPDRFVIKSRVGSTSRGVLPLVRRDSGYLDALATRQGVRDLEHFIDFYERAVTSGRCSPDGVIEELLPSPYGDDRVIAMDVKLYCFYGTVGMIMMRDCDGSRRDPDFLLRYLAPDGSDLGAVGIGRTVDPTLPGPLHLSALVAAGEAVSAAIPSPFVRVDLYERTDGIVFGEITPRPGGEQRMRSDVDRELGRLWEEAEARLRAEALNSGSLSIRYGGHDRDAAAPI